MMSLNSPVTLSIGNCQHFKFDLFQGYSAKKDYQENICYISRIEKGFPSPGKMQNNMEMVILLVIYLLQE